MNVNPASAEEPSDLGSTGAKWAAEEQHWVPHFNTFPVVYVSVGRRQCQERDVVRCFESLTWLAGRRDRSVEHEGTKPGVTQLLFKQEVQARVRKTGV